MDRNDVLERVTYLFNKPYGSVLTDIEQEFLDYNLHALDEEYINVEDSGDSDAYIDVEGLSEVDPDDVPNVPLPDLRVEQVDDDLRLEEEILMQLESAERSKEDLQEDEPVGPNRGKCYKARNVRHSDIWWSMPDEIEKSRAINDQQERKKHEPKCKQIFSKKADAFRSLISPEIIGSIVIDTNRKGKSAYEANRLSTTPKIFRRWYDTDADEMYAYIAVLLYAGAEKLSKEQAKNLFNKHNMPFYRATMSLERFEQISRFVRFDDSRTRQFRLKTDKMAAFRDTWEAFQSNLTALYHPSKELTIDEQLVTTKGKCSFRQYMPNTPGRFGIKIYWVVDAKTNYPLRGKVYLGQQPGDEHSNGIAHGLVMNLLEGFLDENFNVTTDNFFTSVPLALELASRRTTLVGTIRSNKPQLPMEFTKNDRQFKRTRQKYSSIFCFSRCMQLVSYATKKKKNILLLSTLHHSDDIDEESQKPVIIIDYNRNKRGVHTLDQMVTLYTCKRKSDYWPTTLFYNVIDTAAIAAYRLYNISQPEWYTAKNRSGKRKAFIKDLSLELAAKHLEKRILKRSLTNSVKTAMGMIGYERNKIIQFPSQRENTKKQRCEFCKAQKKDNKTTAVCDLCNVPTCTKHYTRICERCYLRDDSPTEDIDVPTSKPKRTRNKSPV